MDVLTIMQLEKIINTLRVQNPSDAGTYSNCEDINILAELYGQMIHFKIGSIGIETIPDKQRAVLIKAQP